jgi:ribosome-associated protein
VQLAIEDGYLYVNEQLSIPLAELSFRFSRSSGPGGQHVQKTSTRVELLFDVANSPSLTDYQRARIEERLASHIDSAGVLHLVAQSERSQLRNREEVLARFQALMRGALKRRKIRRSTHPTATSIEQRLRAKRRRSQVKGMRRDIPDE